MQREVDVIEEILRVYGYNNIKYSHKLNSSISFDDFDDVKIENVISTQLISQGFNETMSNSLTKASYISMSENLNSDHDVAMLNPLSSDLGVLRQSLLFSGLESILYNINRRNSSIKIFESGKTYHKYESGYTEQKHLTLFVSGKRAKDSWITASKLSDFFYLKGVVNTIFAKLGITNVKTSPTKNDVFSEGITVSLGKIKLVDIGVVKKSILKEFGIKQEVLFADFNFDNLLKVAGRKNFNVKELAKYPEVKRDLALLLDDKVTFAEIFAIANQTEKSLLKSVDLFDVYQGDKLPKDKKSYAVSFVLQDENKTLNDKQIDKVMQKMKQSLEKNLGAVLR